MSTQVLIQSVSSTLISLPKVSFGKFCLLGVIFAISLIIFYIFQISEITETSFNISLYERQIVGLSAGNKNLEISLSSQSSLGNLEAALRKLNYEKVGKINYIKVIDSGMAARP